MLSPCCYSRRRARLVTLMLCCACIVAPSVSTSTGATALAGLLVLDIQGGLALVHAADLVEMNDGTPDQAETAQYGHFCSEGGAIAGPKLHDHLLGPRPREFNYWIPLTTFGFLATAAVSGPSLARLYAVDTSDKADSIKRRAMQTRLVVAAPLVIALCKVIVVLEPRAWKPLFLIVVMYEVFAFWNFMWLIFGYVADTEDNIVETFRHVAPLKVWAAAPLCCIWACCYPFMAKRVPCRSDVKLVRAFMWQFMVMGPLCAATEMSGKLSHEGHLRIARLETCCLLVAMYGLFGLLNWTHDLLEGRRAHSKFWTLKGVLIANTAVFRVFNEFERLDARIGDSCYSDEMLAATRAGTVTALLCCPFALLGAYAYPVEDLTGKDEEHDK